VPYLRHILLCRFLRNKQRYRVTTEVKKKEDHDDHAKQRTTGIGKTKQQVADHLAAILAIGIVRLRHASFIQEAAPITWREN